MLHRMRKPVAVVLAFLMCITMFTGIVLPQIAETATAVADPYADVHAKTQELTVTDGKVTPTGTTKTVTVPAEYKNLPVYEAKDTKLFFYNSAWKTPANAGVSAAGDYFVARYGDGKEWGDGKVYLMQYGVNAFGGVDYTGSYAFDDLRGKLQAIVPTVGGDNNYYILFFPGTYANTNTNSTGVGVTDHVFKNPESDNPTVADMMNLHYIGPQAGKSPSMGIVGDTRVNNDRSLDTSREFVFNSTVWLGRNTRTVLDGVAANYKLYFANYSDSNAALEVKNFYFELQSDNVDFLSMGIDKTSSSRLVTIKDSYFKHGRNYSGDAKALSIVGHSITMDNVVFDNVNNAYFNFYPCQKSAASSAFAGGDGKFELNVTNCTFNNWKGNEFIRFRANYANGYADDDSAFINFSNNSVINFGMPGKNSTALSFFDVTRGDSSKTPPVVAVPNPFTTTIANNYIEISPEVTKANNGYMINCNNYPTNSSPITLSGNTFKGNGHTGKLTDIHSADLLLDLSNNLFLDSNNNVRAPRGSWIGEGFTGNAKVCTDVYASDEMSGGINELFTVLDAKQNLFVANSFIQTTLPTAASYAATYGTDIVGTITIMPKPGVTYQAKDLFEYNNPNVTFVGLFSDKACTKAVSSFNSTFTELYAKAAYSKGSTNATVVYKLHKPVEYHFVSLSGATSYKFPFDNVTYTKDTTTNGVTAKFHTTLAAATSAVAGKRPIQTNTANADIDYCKAVIVLTPGTYTTAQEFTYGVAIVGPQLGVSGSDGKSDAVKNGRSTDATKEAVLNATLTFRAGDNPYIAVGGIASSANAVLFKLNTEGDKNLLRTVHFSLQDTYVNAASNNAMINAGINSAKFDPRVTIDNLYYKTTAGGLPIGDLHGNMCHITNSSITMATRAASWIYMAPSNANLRGYVPASVDLVIENNYIARPAATGYGLTCRSTYYNIDSTEKCVDGVNVKYNDNTVIDNNILFRIMYGISKSSFEFTNNIISRASASGAAVLDSYDALGKGMNADMDISKNVFVNCTAPFNFTNNTIPDVNENYYGDATGKVVPIADTAKIDLDTSWWYVDEACTVKTSDIELAKGGFLDVEIVDGVKNFEANLFATNGRTYGTGNFAAKNAEVLGIYKDAAGEVAQGDLSFNGTPITVYVKVKKNDYVATWKVNVKGVDIWGKKGLAPVGSETFVDLSTVDSYKTRTNGNAYKFVFLAADWTTWAYTDAALTTKVSSDTSKLEEGVENTNWGTNDPREIKVGTVFYAKMPTSGIIYKLTYGVTAMNYRHCNTANFATMVFFPGMYNQRAAYNSNDPSYDYTETVGNNGIFGIARADKVPADCKEVNILGPQAGIPGGNVENGSARNPTSTNGNTDVLAECCFAAATNFYVMNGAIGEGKTLNFDGIGGGWGYQIQTTAGSGANNTKTAVTSTINFNNCAFRALNGGQFFLQLYSEKEEVNANANDGKKLSKINMIINFNRTSIELSAGTYGLAKTVANQIHFDECVLLNKARDAASDPFGFYINPVRGDYFTKKVDVSYTCDNSYLDWRNGYLFGVYLNSTKNLNTNTRNKIEVAFRNNTILESSKNAENSSRAAVASFYPSATVGNSLPDAAKITDIIFTNNKVTNSGGYPLYGYMIYGYDGMTDNFNGYRKVDIKGNIFKGYNNMFANFQGYDLKDNLYLDTNGRPMAARFSTTSNLYTTDVVLSEDFSKHATDFNITGGVKMNGALSWSPATLDIHGNASHVYTAGLTAADLENSLVFKSDNIRVVDLYNEDGVTPATTLAEGKTYRLVLTYKDTPDLVNVVYNVTIDPKTDSVPLYNGPKIFWDPDVKDYEAGARVVRELDGKNYQFTVGKNILATVGEFPIASGFQDANGNASCRRDVYLFAKEYGSPDSLSMPDPYRHTITTFYGVNAGKSAVEKDASGIPVGRAADRTDPAKESIFRNATFGQGYQSMTNFDGVMFADYLYLSDTSPERGSFISELKVENCTTHPDAPIYANNANWKCFALNSDAMMYAAKFTNNFFETAKTGYSGNLIVARNTRDVELEGNYYSALGGAGLMYYTTEKYDNKGIINKSITEFNLTVNKNRIDSVISLDSLHIADGIAKNIPVNILFSNNRFELETGVRSINVPNYEGSDERAYVNFKDLSFEVINNEFIGGPNASDFIYIAGLKTEGVNNVDYKALNFFGNTFNYSDEAPVNYAIQNYSDTVIDLSDNTFNGFNASYGDRVYVNPVAPELRIINAQDRFKEAPLTAQNVLFSGASDATFIIEGKTFAADYVAPGVTLADAAASGAKVADGNIITDVATSGPNNNAYTFNPAVGMMVKVTAADGTVYENYYPAITDKNNAKATFTAQLCTIAGTPVGEEYTVTVYVEPIKLNVKKEACSVVHDFATGKATLTWAGTFRGQHSTYITDLINKTGFTIVEYGMFYAADETAVSDTSIAKGYVDGKYTVDSKVLGQKAVYAANTNGLTNVKLDYAHQFVIELPAQTEARYGRMYMTYKVGDTLYTVLSDALTLTMYVAN